MPPRDHTWKDTLARGLNHAVSLSWDDALQVVWVSLLLFHVEAFIAFGLFFQPSWANGWPGLSQATVWGAGMAFMAFTIYLTLAAVFAPIVPFIRGCLLGRPGRFCICTLLVAVCTSSAILATGVFLFVSANF